MRFSYGTKWFLRLLFVSLVVTWSTLYFVSDVPQSKATGIPGVKIGTLHENLYTYVGKRNSSLDGPENIPLDKFLKLPSLFRMLSNVNLVLSSVEDLYNDLWYKDHQDPQKTSRFDGDNKSNALLAVKPRQILLLGSVHSSVDALFQRLRDYVPEAFVHSEPLRSINRLDSVTKPEDVEKALHVIRRLFQCERLSPGHYEFIKKYGHMANWNNNYWRLCEGKEQLCKYPTAFRSICALSPVQFMSTTQLPVALVEEMLKLPALSNLKIVYVSKDPRRVLQSNRNKAWCQAQNTCLNATLICRRMQQDLDYAEILRQKYPGRFRHVPDEEVTVHPVKVLRQLIPFADLPYYSKTLKKLENKYRQPMHEVLSNIVQADSLNTWQSVLTAKEVCNTEAVCQKVLERLNLTSTTKDVRECVLEE